MSGQPSEYLKHLPQALRGTNGTGTGFLDGYLRVFEALLRGRSDTPASEGARPLEGTIAAFPRRLDPGLCPVDDPSASPLESAFLDYLARWVALSFDQNWDLDKRREWLGRIVSLYKRRGTRDGITEYLRMFVGDQVKVEELSGGFIVGVKPYATVGVTSFIAGAPAHYFRVRMNYGFFPAPFEIEAWKNLRKGTRTIVDMEKPAHTYYTLHARTPGIIVGGALYGGPNAAIAANRNKGRATIGKDTLIWRASKPV